jgi:hypothetical protein
VIHGTDEDLLTPTIVLAALAGAVSIPVAGHWTSAAAVVAALIAGALLEEAFARLLFLPLILPLMMGRWRLRGCPVRRSNSGRVAILCGTAVLLAFCLAAFVAATAAAAMSLPGMLPSWVLTLRGAILGLRRYGSLRLRGRGRV